MKAQLRIPTRFLVELVENLKEHPEAAEMTFITYGGNVLLAKRVRGSRVGSAPNATGDYDSWDFFLNPGD